MHVHYIMRYGVLTGLIILIFGLIISLINDISTILWIGIYVIIAVPLISVTVIGIESTRIGDHKNLALLALLEILVVIIYILISLHIL